MWCIKCMAVCPICVDFRGYPVVAPREKPSQHRRECSTHRKVCLFTCLQYEVFFLKSPQFQHECINKQPKLFLIAHLLTRVEFFQKNTSIQHL